KNFAFARHLDQHLILFADDIERLGDAVAAQVRHRVGAGRPDGKFVKRPPRALRFLEHVERLLAFQHLWLLRLRYWRARDWPAPRTGRNASSPSIPAEIEVAPRRTCRSAPRR